MSSEEVSMRNQAIHWAIETDPNRYNIEKKPTPEEIIINARKFLEFFKEGFGGY